jgi:hypothetical protein
MTRMVTAAAAHCEALEMTRAARVESGHCEAVG